MGYRTCCAPVVRTWRGSQKTAVQGRDLPALGESGLESVVVEAKFRAEATGNHALACLHRLPVQLGSALAFAVRAVMARRLSAQQVVIGPPRSLHFR